MIVAACYFTYLADPLNNFRAVIELESTKIGVVLLILGAMHFFNMYVLTKMRNRSRELNHQHAA